jgi:FKBP-type peptidyl-prolyl cis-trans isomerase FklB
MSMKMFGHVILGAALVTTVALGADGTADSVLTDTKAKVSYGIGMNLGQQFRNDELDIDPELLLRGLKEAMAGQPLLMTETEMRNTLQSHLREAQTRRQEKRRLLGETNRAEGEKYLTANKAKEGVVALPSGLQYRVVQEGSGASPKSNDVATVHYRGKLIDGTEFDSSYSRGEPAEFPVNRVIRGWTEALQLMKAGAKWELTIPSALAYGEGGSGAKIGPNAVLLFEVELIAFKTPETPPTPPAPPQAVTSDIIKVPSKEEMDKGAKIEVIKKEDADRMIREQQEKKQPEKK